MARKIEIQLVGDSRSLERALSRSSAATRKFSVGLGTLAKSAVVFGVVQRSMDGLGRALRAGADEWRENISVAAQTQAAIRSTGGVANVSARQVQRLGTAVQAYSGISDEAVRRGANLILTFRNVRNEVGKGSRVFDRATKAAVDLSVAGFGDIATTAKQVGKALQDPIRGITALRRAGVTFTEAQQRSIRSLVETGRLLEAQKIILREIETQVGGSARAFGQTLPGQLAILRESIVDNLGGVVGAVVPLFTGALQEVNDFVGRLSRVQTIRAKLNVVWTGARQAAERGVDLLRRAVGSIDFDAIWGEARGIADGLQRQLEQVDFDFIGREIGDGIARAVRFAIPATKELATRITAAVRAIDFVAIGKAAGPGLAAAVVTAFATITDPAFWVKNWDLALAVAAVVFRAQILKVGARLLAPLRRLGQDLALRIGVGMLDAAPALGAAALRLGALLLRGVGRALAPLGRLVQRTFARLGRLARFTVAVLGIQAAVNVLVGFARRVRDVFNGLWRFLKRSAYQTALAVLEPFSKLPGRFGAWARRAKDALNEQLLEMEAASLRTAKAIEQNLSSVVTSFEKGMAAFRAANASLPAQQPTGGGGRAGGGTAGSPTSATTTARTSGDTADKARQQFEQLMSRLQLAVERADLTKSLNDNLRAQRAIIAALQERVRVAKDDIDAQRQLVAEQLRLRDIVRDIAQQRRDAAKARQFKALGLTAEGDQPIPGLGALRRQFAKVGEAVKGTFLDTRKTRSLMQGVRRVLSGQMGALGEDVRAKIAEILGDINRQLTASASQSTVIKFQKAKINQLLAGMGLSPEVIKELRQRFSQVSGTGRMPQRGVSAFGFGFTAATGGGGGGNIVIHNVTVQNPQDFDAFVREVQRRGQRSASLRTGVRAGANRGMG